VLKSFYSLIGSCLFLILFFLLAGCVDKQEEPGAKGTKLTNKAEVNKSSSQSFELKKTEEIKKATTGVVSISPSLSMLPLFVKGRLVPEDFEIGLLQDQIIENTDQRSIQRKLDLFFQSLISAKINADVIYESRRELLIRSLDYYVEKRMIPDFVRYGVFEIYKDNEAKVSVRLFSKTGRAKGEVFLIARDDGWFITDFQLNFRKLSEDYNKSEKKYIPSHYRGIQNFF
jgi:hypothetical protein